MTLKCCKVLTLLITLPLINACSTPQSSADLDVTGTLTKRAIANLEKSSFQAVRLSNASHDDIKLNFYTKFEKGKSYELSRYKQRLYKEEEKNPIIFNIIWHNQLSLDEIRNPLILGEYNGIGGVGEATKLLFGRDIAGETWGVVVDENLCATENRATRQNRLDQKAYDFALLFPYSGVNKDVCFEITQK